MPRVLAVQVGQLPQQNGHRCGRCGIALNTPRAGYPQCKDCKRVEPIRKPFRINLDELRELLATG